MTDLDIAIHNDYKASIKDLEHDLNISDAKWNSLFKQLAHLFSAVYFEGDRKWQIDNEFEQTIDFLAEKRLISERIKHYSDFFKLKPGTLTYNRRLLSKMWDYYEWPRLIFIGDEENCAKIEAFDRKNLAYLTEKFHNILILSRRMELNVLWLESDFDVHPLFNDYKV